MFRNEHGRSFLNDAIRGAVDQCTSVYTGQRQVFLTKNLLLFGTTAVRGGKGTAGIKSSARINIDRMNIAANNY